MWRSPRLTKTHFHQRMLRKLILFHHVKRSEIRKSNYSTPLLDMGGEEYVYLLSCQNDWRLELNAVLLILLGISLRVILVFFFFRNFRIPWRFCDHPCEMVLRTCVNYCNKWSHKTYKSRTTAYLCSMCVFLLLWLLHYISRACSLE